jgi:hypothetical protein
MKVVNESTLRYKIEGFVLEVTPQPVQVPAEVEGAVRIVAERFPLDIKIVEDVKVPQRKK